jgi:SAM-dependent methyltransferase
MSLQVLQSTAQVDESRRVMQRRGLSAIDTRLDRLMRRFGLLRNLAVGDRKKSWDVLLALLLIEQRIAKTEPVADIGCFSSEVLIALHMNGYQNLTGIDLNPALKDMPLSHAIRYQISDFMHTPFDAGAFTAITAISVIEHGFRPAELLAEVSRLLRPGGIFFASFDYWPDKIDTKGKRFFGMDWLIFSRRDIEDFIAIAAKYGLQPTGELDFRAADKVIECAGMSYTFAALALTKRV